MPHIQAPDLHAREVRALAGRIREAATVGIVESPHAQDQAERRGIPFALVRDTIRLGPHDAVAMRLTDGRPVVAFDWRTGFGRVVRVCATTATDRRRAEVVTAMWRARA